MEEKEANDILEQCNKSKLIVQQIRTGCEKVIRYYNLDIFMPLLKG